MTKNKYNYYQVFDDNFQQYCILLNIYDYDFILPPHTIFCQAFCENILISGVSIRGIQYIFLSCTQIRLLLLLRISSRENNQESKRSDPSKISLVKAEGALEILGSQA